MIMILLMLKGAMKKYDRYYTLMDDSCDILYITMFLDPRFKKIVLENELNCCYATAA